MTIDISTPKLEWTETSPTLPGRYLWTCNGDYEVVRVEDWGDGHLCVPPGSDAPDQMDGWWIGPLPEPLEFIIRPRARESRTATRAKTLAIPQDQLLRCLRGERLAAYAILDSGIYSEYCRRQRRWLRERDRSKLACPSPWSMIERDRDKRRQENVSPAIYRETRISRFLSVMKSWLRVCVYFRAERSR